MPRVGRKRDVRALDWALETLGVRFAAGKTREIISSLKCERKCVVKIMASRRLAPLPTPPKLEIPDGSSKSQIASTDGRAVPGDRCVSTGLAPGKNRSRSWQRHGLEIPRRRAACPAAPQWNQPDFDDSQWKLGKAPLGYGEPRLGTQIRSGADAAHQAITTSFRCEFDASELKPGEPLVILCCIDDAGNYLPQWPGNRPREHARWTARCKHFCVTSYHTTTKDSTLACVCHLRRYVSVRKTC